MCTLSAQTKCMLGLEYGMSMEAVKTKLKTDKGQIGTEVDVEQHRSLFYPKCNFAGEDDVKLMFIFKDNALISGVAYFNHPQNKAIKIYEEQKANLVAKYGEPFSEKFNEKIKQETLMRKIKNHTESAQSIWIFEGRYAISVSINENLELVMMYFDQKQIDKLSKDIQDKKSKDL